jgi:hypothetical protein
MIIGTIFAFICMYFLVIGIIAFFGMMVELAAGTDREKKDTPEETFQEWRERRKREKKADEFLEGQRALARRARQRGMVFYPSPLPPHLQAPVAVERRSGPPTPTERKAAFARTIRASS